MKLTTTLPGATSTPLPPARMLLRELYRAARQLQFTTPYAPARLSRIADQAEYLLQEWPLEQWPPALHSGQPLPARHVLLTWVATVRRDAAELPNGSPSYAAWQQASTLLLATLVPFA